MRTTLQTIADIRMGYTFRDKIVEDPDGDVRVLQIKDIKGGSAGFPADLPCIRWQGAGAPPVLEPGDVVLPARGEYYEAVLVEDVAPVVATGQLFVLHTVQPGVMPEYLCWWLNQPTARAYILANRRGSNIPMLNKQALADLPVTVPPMEVQRKIVSIQRVWEREKTVTMRLLDNRQTMLNGIFQQLLRQ